MVSMRVRLTVIKIMKQTGRFANITTAIIKTHAKARPIFCLSCCAVIASVSQLEYILEKLNPPGIPER